MVNLIKTVEKFQNDPSTSKEAVKEYKRKINEYKHKVKQANQVIEKMMATMGGGHPQNPDLLV